MCNGIITNLLSSTLCRDRGFMMNIYKTYIRPLMEYCGPLWNMGYIGDTRSLERVQKRWTKSVYGLGEMSYQNQLLTLDLFSFQGRLLRGDLILVWKIFNHECSIFPEQVFIMDTSSTRGHDFKIFMPRFNLDTRKYFFSVRIIRPWNSLSRDTVSCTSLTSFKVLLHRDLGQKLYEYDD